MTFLSRLCRSNPDDVARVKAFKAFTHPARMLEDVHNHLLLAIAAIHSGDEDTAALEITAAGSLMRAAVEELRA